MIMLLLDPFYCYRQIVEIVDFIVESRFILDIKSIKSKKN